MLYQPRLYINRAKLFAEICRWLSELSPKNRLLSLVGTTGLGKSWFMNHLFLWLHDQPECIPIWLDLSQNPFEPSIASGIQIQRPVIRNIKEWLGKYRELAQGKCASSLSYDDLIAFEVMLRQFAQELCNNCGSKIPILLIDGYDEVGEADQDYLLERICAIFYDAGCTRIMIARRDDISLPHPLLRWQEQFVRLIPLNEAEREEQIARLDTLLPNPAPMQQVVKDYLCGNPFVNAILRDQVIYHSQVEQLHLEKCIDALLKRGGAFTFLEHGDLLLQLAILEEQWTVRDLRHKVNKRLEDPSINQLFTAGFIQGIKGTPHYQLDSELRFLLNKYQEINPGGTR
jgi:hypothetical protein